MKSWASIPNEIRTIRQKGYLYTLRSPRGSLPKRKILPQTSTNLIQSQIMEFHDKNAKITQLKSLNHHTTLAIEPMIKCHVISIAIPNKKDLKLTIFFFKKDDLA